MAEKSADLVIAPPVRALSDEQKARIRQAAGTMSCLFVAPEDLDVVASAAQAVACRHGQDLSFMTRSPRPKWVHSWSAGVDGMPAAEVADSGMVLTCAKSNGAIALGEHVLMLMMMLQRDTLQWAENQRRKQWSKHVIGELYGKTCGIIGLGYIGKETAMRAKAFGMRTIGIKRSREPVANVDEVLDRNELNTLLAQSDFVIVTAPHTPQTDNMIDAAAIALMKKSAFIVVVSRGNIVDEEALFAALAEGRIAGAGLDDFAIEPLPESSPLWSAPNTIITPHNGPSSEETGDRGFDIFIDNVARWRAGEPLRNVVDLSAGY